jgi:hypothetical protein
MDDLTRRAVASKSCVRTTELNIRLQEAGTRTGNGHEAAGLGTRLAGPHETLRVAHLDCPSDGPPTVADRARDRGA